MNALLDFMPEAIEPQPLERETHSSPSRIQFDHTQENPAQETDFAGQAAPNTPVGAASLNALLARTVKRLRQERGLSQEDLAGLAKVDRTYISGIERARRNITIGTLERLIPHLANSSVEFFQVLCGEMQSNERATPKLTTHRAN